mmetsp:Transcript_30539/g.58814  ORF Transcript_30539/g.58814 Transcript_30539/m.58814 type:complete len:272 (+) Transcript_30539:936-1751(+)
MLESSAMRRFLLISKPFASTMPERSTSVSKMTPRCAPWAFTACAALFMAEASSGLGTWLGKRPSGSRNWLPVVSAPSGSSTWLAKKPPLPLPASTTILSPFRGRSKSSGSLTPCLMSCRSCAAYSGMNSTWLTTPGSSVSLSGAAACRAADSRMNFMSGFFNPPAAVKNLIPLRFHGRWEAVHIRDPEYWWPKTMVLMKHAGVVAKPMSAASTPLLANPARIAATMSGPDSRGSRPTDTLNLDASGPAPFMSHSAKPHAILNASSGDSVTS